MRKVHADKPYYIYDNIIRPSARPGVLAFCTSRHCGTMGAVAGDRDEVNKNRKALSVLFDIPLKKMVFANQVHRSKIEVVTNTHIGKHFESGKGIKATDGLITNIPGICVLIRHSDCVPIILYDPKQRVIGAIHAGRLGTVAKIAIKAVQKMGKHFGCTPENIVAELGPCIGSCCYEIDKTDKEDCITPIQKAFKNSGNLFAKWHSNDTKAFFNLPEANKQLLIAAGLAENNIHLSGICTKCRADEFFSSRDGDRANCATGIMLRRK